MSVPFTTVDQTPNIANDLANTTVNIFKILGGGVAPEAPTAPAAAPPPPAKLAPFKYTFDPLDAAETADVEARLRTNFHLKVMIICPKKHVTQSCIGNQLAASGKSIGPAEAEIDKDNPRTGGVMFHPPEAVEIRFDFTGIGSELIDHETYTVPDVERVACFRFGRSPFVNRDTALTLSNGMPTSFTITRPSPIHGLTTALSTVTGTIATAIPTIMNVKINQEVADLNAKKSLIDAQNSLATSQNTLATTLASQKKIRHCRYTGAKSHISYKSTLPTGSTSSGGS